MAVDDNRVEQRVNYDTEPKSRDPQSKYTCKFPVMFELTFKSVALSLFK